MAKLKTMVPEEVFEWLLWQRETMTIGWVHGLDPEAEKLIHEITEDRVEVLRQAFAAEYENGHGNKRG